MHSIQFYMLFLKERSRRHTFNINVGKYICTSREVCAVIPVAQMAAKYLRTDTTLNELRAKKSIENIFQVDHITTYRTIF